MSTAMLVEYGRSCCNRAPDGKAGLIRDERSLARRLRRQLRRPQSAGGVPGGFPAGVPPLHLEYMSRI